MKVKIIFLLVLASGNFPVNSQEILQNILDFTYSVIYGLPISPSGPSNVTENDVTFYLFNQTFKDEPLILSEENLNTLSKNKKLVIIIHGYIENGLKFSYVGIKDAYLEKNDYNVILADWQEPASKVYSVSAANTRFIGNIIAGRVIKSKVPLEQIHIVGHSLGAQVSGFAGKEIKRLTNGSKIGRITGIDPAGPLFEGASTLNRLHKEDALFVDIIHTDGGKFGIVENVGHVDFYPNGGRALQPGCKEIPEIPENVDEFISTAFCSHQISVDFFRESISSNKFVARIKCSTPLLIPLFCYPTEETAVMGEATSIKSEGIYYMKTKS